MIGHKNAFLMVLHNTYKRMQEGRYYGRETEAGLQLAISYLNEMDAETLTKHQIKHICRVCCYPSRVSNHTRMATA